MSADNGVYVLSLPGAGEREYRVIHAQAIENITYEHPDGDPMQVVEYFGKVKVFTSYEEAFAEAQRLADEIMKDDGILEYGIELIELPYPMSVYKQHAIPQLVQEIQDIAEGKTNLVKRQRMWWISGLAKKLMELLPSPIEDELPSVEFEE